MKAACSGFEARANSSDVPVEPGGAITTQRFFWAGHGGVFDEPKAELADIEGESLVVVADDQRDVGDRLWHQDTSPATQDIGDILPPSVEVP